MLNYLFSEAKEARSCKYNSQGPEIYKRRANKMWGKKEQFRSIVERAILCRALVVTFIYLWLKHLSSGLTMKCFFPFIEPTNIIYPH